MLDFIKKYYLYIIIAVVVILLGSFASSFVQEQLEKEKIEVIQQYEKKLEEQSNKWATVVMEARTEINSLKSENSTLRTKSKTIYYKIVKPDGTVEVRKESETQSDFEKQITEQMKTKYEQKLTETLKEEKSKHEAEVASLHKQLESFSSKKPVAKLHAIQLGYGLGFKDLIAPNLSGNMYHLRYSYSFLDPFFATVGLSSNLLFHGVDLGIGLRF